MKKVVALGEVLLRLSAKGHLKFSQATEFSVNYGGSELNVLTELANFGIQTEIITCLPENDIAEAALMQMRKYKIGTDFVLKRGQRLGLYFLENGVSVRGSKVIYDRSHSSFAEVKKGMINWEAVFKDAFWFHWSGITPGISQGAADICTEAIEKASELGITISTDFNYRSNLWNYGKSPREIMTKMVSKCHIILAGEYASKCYFNIVAAGNSKEELQKSLCENIKKQFPNAQRVIITNRDNISALHNKWSAFMYDGNSFLKSKSYDITDIIDRIGAGDSFMGSLIYGLNHFNDQKALDFAIAASCLKHTIYGDANLVSIKDIENLMDGDVSGRVRR